MAKTDARVQSDPAQDEQVTREQVTRDQARDAVGRLIDVWGLPVNALWRAEALRDLGLPDPLDDTPASRRAWAGRVVGETGSAMSPIAPGAELTNAKEDDRA